MKTERFLPFLISASLLAACQGEEHSPASPAAGHDGAQIRFEVSLRGADATSLRGAEGDAQQRHCERSEANQKECGLDCFGVPPRNDDADGSDDATTSLRAKRGNPENDTLDCFGTSPRNDVTTRATTTGFTTVWDTNDEIGLFAVPHGEQLAGTGNLIHNAMLTRQADGSWAGEVYWPNTGQAYDFYAYYPYDATITDPMGHIFLVQTDQRAEPDYNRSDLLTATTTGVSRSTAAVALQFSHALSLVQVAVEREVNMPLFIDDDFTVTLTGVMPGATLGWDGPSTATGTPTSITMHKVAGMDYTYRALVPAQTLAADSKVTFVQTTPDKKIDMWYNRLASADLTAGQAHRHEVTLGWNIDPAHVYEVGHRYPHVGPTIGIVFYIENNGKNGKAVSLTESDGVKWADAYDNTGATDWDNGRANMYTIYNRANDFSGYPVFAWVHRLNPPGTDYRDESATGVWYLPAVSEWSVLSGSTFATVNAALNTAEGTAISGEYWSSTEYASDKARGNGLSNNDKTDLRKARAIIAF